jgi:hypothetical protein
MEHILSCKAKSSSAIKKFPVFYGTGWLIAVFYEQPCICPYPKPGEPAVELAMSTKIY